MEVEIAARADAPALDYSAVGVERSLREAIGHDHDAKSRARETCRFFFA